MMARRLDFLIVMVGDLYPVAFLSAWPLLRIACKIGGIDR
jgi:hypothetical protein